MTSKQITDAIRAEPFQPFTMHLADGRKFSVKHPEFVAHAPNGRTVIWLSEKEDMEVIDVLMITSLSSKNGRSTRGRGKKREG